MYDMHNNIFVETALNTSAISSNTTTVGAAIGTAGYEAIEFVIKAGAVTDGTYTPEITECATSGGSYTAVADADLLGLESEAVFTSTSANKCARIGYKGRQPFVKLTLISTAVTTGGSMTAIVIKGRPLVQKTAANAQ